MSAEEKQRVKDEIRSINSYAQLVETTNSDVDLKKIFAVSAYSVEHSLEVDPDFLDEDPLSAPSGGG